MPLYNVVNILGCCWWNYLLMGRLVVHGPWWGESYLECAECQAVARLRCHRGQVVSADRGTYARYAIIHVLSGLTRSVHCLSIVLSVWLTAQVFSLLRWIVCNAVWISCVVSPVSNRSRAPALKYVRTLHQQAKKQDIFCCFMIFWKDYTMFLKSKPIAHFYIPST